SIEMDDVHNASSLHPAVAVIPAALAVAEERGSSGRELTEAIIAGYEVILRIGEAANPSAVYRRGFHPTAVCGVFSSAAAAGSLMNLTPDQMVNAFGLAWAFAAGNMSFQREGSWAKRIQVGNTARCGVQAARLAAMGATGPAHVFEKHGFFESYSGELQVERLLGELGNPLKILECGIKPFACCRYNQTPVDLLLEWKIEHSVELSEIERIDIEIASTGLPLVAIPAESKKAPANSVEAQFSLYYSAAVALAAGAAGRNEYREPWLNDSRILTLARKVHVGSSAEIDNLFPAKWAARVKVRMNDGTEREKCSESCLGDPEKPLAPDQLMEKFESLTGGHLNAGSRHAIASAVNALERKEKAAELISIILTGLKTGC
ncbi:MmgE/PrpD family protein, partial [Candidatus Sumerlaeota bacterium]|nr:MmgE/PrpD family protein [Candidatus Sumerlaeota bacterium]